MLARFGVDPEYVVAVLSGEVDPFSGFFSGPINFDTIEGVLRTRQFALPQASALAPSKVVLAAINRATTEDRDAVDNFWLCKDEVYLHIIKSRQGVLADHLFQSLALRHLNRLSPADFLATEAVLFDKLPELRTALRTSTNLGLTGAMVKLGIDVPSVFTSRSFHINASANFFRSEDFERYTQSKHVSALTEAYQNGALNATSDQMDFLNETIA